jgi:ABC-2 type transport system ATP-binding protein
MQQKVQFAVTVLHEPELIIVDEPFSGLDPVNTLVIKDLITEMRDRGTAIIMSTHQMNQVEEMADRLLMINRGKQALYGSVSEVRQQYALHAIIVEGEGDWASIRGVERVVRDPNSRDGMLLHLHPDTPSDVVLETIAHSERFTINRFQMAVPSLNDIFIQVAGERVNGQVREQREVANA